MIRPAGLGGIAAAGHRCTATVKASWTDSSARSMSPNTRTRTATARPYSARKTRSIAVGSGLARGDTVRPGTVPARGMPAGPRGPDPEPPRPAVGTGHSVLGFLLQRAHLDRRRPGLCRLGGPRHGRVAIRGLDH